MYATAFNGCESLGSLRIHGNLTEIKGWHDTDVFMEECSSLLNIYVSNDNPSYADINGILYNKDISTLIRFPEAKSTTRFDIPSTVTEIKQGAFNGCRQITHLVSKDLPILDKHVENFIGTVHLSQDLARGLTPVSARLQVNYFPEIKDSINDIASLTINEEFELDIWDLFVDDLFDLTITSSIGSVVGYEWHYTPTALSSTPTEVTFTATDGYGTVEYTMSVLEVIDLPGFTVNSMFLNSTADDLPCYGRTTDLNLMSTTATTYTLVEADIAKSISIEVSSSIETGSIASDVTAAIAKADEVTPSAPILVSKTHNSITLNAIDGCEYAIAEAMLAVNVDDLPWQSSEVFAALSAEVEYNCYQRIAVTSTHNASAVSAALSVTTDADNGATLNKALEITNVKVYPNPASNELNISNVAEGAEIALFDAAGKKVLQQMAESSEALLDISGLKSGVYLININGSISTVVIEN